MNINEELRKYSECGNLFEIKKLIYDYNALIRDKDADGVDAFKKSIKGGHINIIQLFVETCSISIDIDDVLYAVKYTEKNEHIEILKYIINNISFYKNTSVSLLQYSINIGNLNVVKYIIENMLEFSDTSDESLGMKRKRYIGDINYCNIKKLNYN